MEKVLILSASAGAGHLRAADALKKAFEQTGAAKEAVHLDVLQYTNPLFRRLYGKGYIDLVQNAPEILGWLYDHMDKPWADDRLRLAFEKLNARPLIKMLEKIKPEVVVSTHFLPSELISYLKRKERLDTKLATVVTDFDVHAMWLCRYFEHYFVALEETRRHLIALGIENEKISVTGIPIDPVFAEKKDKRQMRIKHGLEPDKLTFVVSAGGFGVGPIEHLIKSLMQLQSPAQVVAIAGRSVELKERLEQLAAEPHIGDVGLKVIGFTTEMDELMSASDFIVGKPGGLTTSEALAKGLIYVVVNPIPGQEERNSDHLLEKGLAIRCNNLPVLAFKIEELLQDKARIQAMQERVLAFGKPRAAFDIVDRVVKIAAKAPLS